MNKKSFTLIELVVVIVVAIIIATMGALTQFKSYNSLKLDAAVQKIASDIRYAQELVMSYSPLAAPDVAGEPYILVVDFEDTTCAPNSYCVKGIPEHIVTNPVTGKPWQVNFNDEFKGVTLSSYDIATGGYPPIIFFQSPKGSAKACIFAWGSGEIEWPTELNSAGATITFSYGNRTKTIRIARATGRVSIE